MGGNTFPYRSPMDGRASGLTHWAERRRHLEEVRRVKVSF